MRKLTLFIAALLMTVTRTVAFEVSASEDNSYVAKIGEQGYETLSAAFAAVTDDAQTVVVLCDVEEELTGAYLRGNITTENGAKITIKLTNADWVYCPYTFVLGENITLNVPALFYYAGGAQINGTVLADAYYQRYAGTKLTINEPGSMTVTSEMCYLRYMDGDANAGIYINGDNNDETVGLNLAVAYFYQGMINAKNANISVGTYWQTNETDNEGSANLVLDNSKMTVTVNEHNMKATGNSTVTLSNGSNLKIAAGLVTAENTTVVVNGSSFTSTNVANNGTFEVFGESTLKINTLTGSSIDLCEGAIINNSTVGGAAYVAGNVIFRGDNSFAMITDYGDYYSKETPSKWTVEQGASLTLTKSDRYGLGYGDAVTVRGDIENALTARANLTDADASVNMYGGLVGMTNNAAPDAQNEFTAENAYLIFGVEGDKSFGNKSGDYYGNYAIDFTNCVVTANGFKFYEDKGQSVVTFKNTDLLVNGVLMTNDTNSAFTFENCVVLSKATSNGSDDKNQNAGSLTLIGTQITYSALFTNVGELTIDANSCLTAPAVAGNGSIIIDAEGMTVGATPIVADMTGFEGAIEIINNDQLAYEIDEKGNLMIVEKPLAGEGTEANPYLINSIDDLVIFRNSVNAGETKYNDEGVYVALGDDIDMAGIDWSVNIGDDCNATFDGIFDGQGHTIYNLTATETAKKADGYVCTGLFGAIYGNAVVKNFTIENVSINTGDFTGNNAAAVVGFAYASKGSVENVIVKGDILINAKGITATGAIVGYAYGSSMTVKDCQVIGNDGSAITGAAYVGGIIGYSTKDMLNDNTVENVAITGTSCAAGGVAGIMLAGGSAADNSVKNVTLVSTHENWQNAIGVVVGTITSYVTIANTTYENVNTTALAGAVHADKPTAPVAKVAAKIGDVYYTTVEAAMKADGLVESLLPIALTDGEEYVAYEENCQVGQLSYTRTLSAANVWMPLYVPFEIPVEMLGEDYEVATFHAYHETLDENGYVVEGGAYVELVKIKGGTLYANRPYLIKAKNEAALEMNLELTDAILYGASSERLAVTCSSATHEFTFSGTYQKSDRAALGYEEGKTACFAMSGGSLAAMSEKAQLGAYRIYMTSTVKPGAHYAATSAAHAISLRVIGEESADGTTVIYDVENDAQAVDCIYDLQGRRVQEPQKGGLYIINGKKVIF